MIKYATFNCLLCKVDYTLRVEGILSCPNCGNNDPDFQRLLTMKENPKYVQAQKDGKLPMEYVPWNVMGDIAKVFKHGADKYGQRNWRIDPIKASTYEASIARHTLLEWAQGVDKDHDSGIHPLAHVAAACMIVMDAEQHGTLIDDRGRKETVDAGAD